MIDRWCCAALLTLTPSLTFGIAIHGGAPPTPPPDPPIPTYPPPPGPTPPAPPTTPPVAPPGDTQPKGNGPTTPGGSVPTGPRQPAPGSRGPSTGGITPGPGTPTVPRGPVTGGMDSGPNLEAWTYWWEFNQYRFLQLRDKVGAVEGVETPATGDELLTAKGRTSMHPTVEELRGGALPALFAAAESESHPILVSCALRALGSIGADAERTRLLLERRCAHNDRRVAETATLSLGLLGAADCVKPLQALLEDGEAGRGLAGGRVQVPWRMRSFAAFGLALASSRIPNAAFKARIQKILLELLDDDRRAGSANREIRISVIAALGMMPDPDHVAALALQRYFEKHVKTEEYICSHIPTALARLSAAADEGERGRVAAQIEKWLSDDGMRSPRWVRAGCAIALGVLAKPGDAFGPHVADVLTATAEKEQAKCPEAASLALVSLGELAGACDPGSAHEKYLLDRALASGGRVMSRAWAAIGLGIAGFDQRARNVAATGDRDSISKLLRERMRELKDPSQSSAFALALGLRRDAASSEALLQMMENIRDEQFRGYFPVALGLIEARQAAKPLVAAVGKSRHQSWMLYQLAVGLALLREKAVVPQLTEMMAAKENEGSAVQTSLADAVGIIGDYRALPTLAALLADESRSSMSRASAATALGIVGDASSEPWHSRILSQFNYIAPTETVNEFIWGIF